MHILPGWKTLRTKTSKALFDLAHKLAEDTRSCSTLREVVDQNSRLCALACLSHLDCGQPPSDSFV